MANQWYVQHAGKIVGPLTSAQLKQLANDGKIASATQVRLGENGKWSPARRVQGLFPDPAPPAIQPPAAILPETSLLPETTAPPPIMPPRGPVAPPLVVQPLAARLVTAQPLAAQPLNLSGAAGPASPPIAGKLVGAVGLIFGTLALATFWLPLLDATLGWTGIVVGALGLLLGIAGLVLAAKQAGVGLYLNVAAASCSLIGLVLTVVLGVRFGMFSGPARIEPLPVIVARPALAPEPLPEPAPEPEPVAEPVIVWTDASQPIDQPPIRARIVGVGMEQLRLESQNFAQVGRDKPSPFLRLRITLENTSADKPLTVPGWNGGGVSLGGLEKSLAGSELGGQLAAATATATLIDDQGHNYPQIPALRLPAAQAHLTAESALEPGKALEKHVVFAPPQEGAEYLRVEFSPAGYGGSEPLRFEVPKALWTKP